MSTRGQTVQHKKAFLASFRTHGNVVKACVASGATRSKVYEWKVKDERFGLAFAEAESEAIQHLEAEAHRRAVEGTVKPIYQGGVEVGRVREYSDTLLIFLLKAHAPEKYRERYDMTSAGQPLIKGYGNVPLGEV